MVWGKGTGSRFIPRSRLVLIWGLASYALIALGLIPLVIAPGNASAQWVAVSLALAGAALLIARAAVLVIGVLMRRRIGSHSGQAPDDGGRPRSTDRGARQERT